MILKKYIRVILLLSVLLLSSCSSEEPPQSAGETSEISAGSDITVLMSSETRVTDPKESPEAISARPTVTFAPAETEPAKEKKTTAERPETTAAALPSLAENQIEYTCKDFSVLMEFTGAESVRFYPQSARTHITYTTDYILHSKFTVTNSSERCFDFYAPRMYIHGSHKNNRGVMLSAMIRDSKVTPADIIAVEPGETVNFDIDFRGDEVCIDYAYQIVCKAIKYTDHEDHSTDYDTYNDTSKGKIAEFKITDRGAVKKAVSAARNGETDNAPQPLVPMEGEYSALTPKSSYCFTAEPICDGKYIRINLRVQCLTGEPLIFRPGCFYLYTADGDDRSPNGWSFDKALSTSEPQIITDMEGISETVYKAPWNLAVRPDGTAEFTMYFYAGLRESDEFYKFCYDTHKVNDSRMTDEERDDFECILNMA